MYGWGLEPLYSACDALRVVRGPTALVIVVVVGRVRQVQLLGRRLGLPTAHSASPQSVPANLRSIRARSR